MSLPNSNSIDLQKFISIVLYIKSILMSTAVSLFVSFCWYLCNNLTISNILSIAEKHCKLFMQIYVWTSVLCFISNTHIIDKCLNYSLEYF